MGREIENMNTHSSPVMRRLAGLTLYLGPLLTPWSVHRLPKDACDSCLAPLAFSRGCVLTVGFLGGFPTPALDTSLQIVHVFGGDVGDKSG